MRDTKGFKCYMAALVTVGLLGIIILLVNVDIKETSKDVLLVVLGALVAIVKDVFGYYFGSSEGSQRKTELMKGAADGQQSAS